MKCPNCGATVLKGDTTCKKCGYVLNEAKDSYQASEQYRSRFMLLFRTWLGGWVGGHLRWLGYTEEAKVVREKYGFGISILVRPWKILASCAYQVVECIAVMFGKYRTDADGHPVRYFKPKA